MRFITREDLIDRNYRKVEAMYRKGCTTKDIAKSCGLQEMDVLDITQRVFHYDMNRY